MSPEPGVIGISEIIKWLLKIPLKKIGEWLGWLNQFKVKLGVLVVIVVVAGAAIAGVSLFLRFTSTPIAGGAGVDLTGYCGPARPPFPGGNECSWVIQDTNLNGECVQVLSSQSAYFRLSVAGNPYSGICLDSKNPNVQRGLPSMNAVCDSQMLKYGLGYMATLGSDNQWACTKTIDFNTACAWTWKSLNVVARYKDGGWLCYERRF